MTRDKFDRFMVANANGHNLKLARFSDAEFRAVVQGVWPIASLADVRGSFMVGDTPATADDVVFMAPKVTKRAADSAIKKMRQLGMLEFDEELGGEWVHDWDKLNPSPKKDTTNAKRQAEWRARNAKSNGSRNGVITPPEVEVEVEEEEEVQQTANAVSVEPIGLDHATAVKDLFAYWQEQCKHPQAKATQDRKRKIGARLREGYSPEQIRQAIDGAAKAPFVNDAGVTFDDIELICRNGAKVEQFIGRASAETSAGKPLANSRDFSRFDQVVGQ